MNLSPHHSTSSAPLRGSLNSRPEFQPLAILRLELFRLRSWRKTSASGPSSVLTPFGDTWVFPSSFGSKGTAWLWAAVPGKCEVILDVVKESMADFLWSEGHEVLCPHWWPGCVMAPKWSVYSSVCMCMCVFKVCTKLQRCRCNLLWPCSVWNSREQ